MSHQQLLDRAYRFIRSRGVPALDAEDIHNDMLIAFTRSAQRRNWDMPSSEFTPLMIDIAKKLIINRARAMARRPCTLLEDNELELLAVRFGPPCSDNADRRLDVRRALARLSAKQRTALVLRYFDGFTIDEVAAMMKLSSTAVKKHVRTGIATLKNSGSLAGYEPRSTSGRFKHAGISEAQA